MPNDHVEAVERIVQIVLKWAISEATIRAVALVGSHARGTAKRGSDIDLVVLTTDPNRFRIDQTWPEAVDWGAIGARLAKWKDEDYGPLWSRRLWLDDNRGEIEVGFAPPHWADVNPLDPGTRRVIADGRRILYDPEGLLARACAASQGE
jgi:predicted nucleotidyltransferase